MIEHVSSQADDPALLDWDNEGSLWSLAVMLGIGPWEAWRAGVPAAVIARRRSGRSIARGACPVCGGRVRRRAYCAWCDKCGLDGRRSYPGLPVGYAMADGPATATVYRRGRLRGGLG